ncbi:MAG: hypothetical protein KIT16_03180 [Rhodospirillaceae bacterium]|nr:hypothetical protein [Rhodospirillaceae bacterium]
MIAHTPSDPIAGLEPIAESTAATATAAQLEEAYRNLETRCDVIGIYAEFDASLARLAAFLGWPPFGAALDINVSRVRPGELEVPARALEMLAEWTALDRQLYEHALRLVEAHPYGRKRAAPAPLPPAHGYLFDQPLHGAGWQLREKDAGGWFCWTGREPTSRLFLRPPENAVDHVLTLHVAHVIEPEALQGLTLAVNGEPLAIRLDTDRARPAVEAQVPGRLLAADAARLELALTPGSRRRPCDIGMGRDTRQLGISVNLVELVPASAR